MLLIILLRLLDGIHFATKTVYADIIGPENTPIKYRTITTIKNPYSHKTGISRVMMAVRKILYPRTFRGPTSSQIRPTNS